jgi:hypothetical protein
MELDRASLLHVLSKLPPEDVAACQAASKALAALGRAPTLWAAHLKRDFGLELVRGASGGSGGRLPCCRPAHAAARAATPGDARPRAHTPPPTHPHAGARPRHGPPGPSGGVRAPRRRGAAYGAALPGCLHGRRHRRGRRGAALLGGPRVPTECARALLQRRPPERDGGGAAQGGARTEGKGPAPAIHPEAARAPCHSRRLDGRRTDPQPSTGPAHSGTPLSTPFPPRPTPTPRTRAAPPTGPTS